ncbi:MAG: 16S rRNA (adenine(1518)-N(6)/adenine(1519)-N(6))-dimethyltransferase RsmA [Parcubacteria group bacterium]
MNKFTPKKYLGQNFLINQKIIDNIIAAADIKKTDNILEVGPGKGALTFKLAAKAKKVVAVEKDRRLAEILNSKLEILNSKQIKNQCSAVVPTGCTALSKLKIINEDILNMTVDALRSEFNDEKYKIVANLPYQITSFFLRKFLESDYAPSEMVIMVQKEVGERIVAKPARLHQGSGGQGKMSLLAVAVQFYAAPVILFHVKRGNFSPAPKVDSVVLRLKDINQKKYGVEPDKFFALVKKGFRFKRKLLKNNLELPAAFLKNAGFREDVRAEQLFLEDWVKIYAMANARCVE